MMEVNEELRAAIEARDTLIERIRGRDIDNPGDPSLLPEMRDACRRVEELTGAFEVNA